MLSSEGGHRMLDEKETQLQARFAAIETLVTNAVALSYRANGFTEAHVQQLHEAMMSARRAETFEGADPATADVLSSEIEDAMRGLLDAVSTRWAALTKR